MKPTIKEPSPSLSFRRGFSTRSSTDWLIIHHVGSMPQEDVNAEVIHRWHLDNGWNGIGYQFVVLPNGIIESGRPLDAVGAHARGVNSVSVGVCVVGDFRRQVPTREQIASLVELGQWLREQWPTLRVAGHQQFADTECPGRLFPLDFVRNEIKGLTKGKRMEEDLVSDAERLTWKQKQSIDMIRSLSNKGLLNDPEQHVEQVRQGYQLGDFVWLTLINRIANEVTD